MGQLNVPQVGVLLENTRQGKTTRRRFGKNSGIGVRRDVRG
jgi:hypothetical protein